MKRILLFVCLALCSVSNLQAALLDQLKSYLSGYTEMRPAALRVLILHDQPTAQISVKGRYKMYDPHRQEYLTTRLLGKSSTMLTTPEGLKWGEEFPGLFQLQIVPAEPSSRIYVNGTPYQGSIFIYDIGGTLSIVNSLKIEDYVALFLAAHYSPQLPQEALAALAISARTYAYYLLENPQNPYWAIEAGSARYKGVQPVPYLDPNFTKALNETRDMIMVRSFMEGEAAKPFPAKWEVDTASTKDEVLPAKITFPEAEKLAKGNKDAADILKKAFPDASLRLVTQGAGTPG